MKSSLRSITAVLLPALAAALLGADRATTRDSTRDRHATMTTTAAADNDALTDGVHLASIYAEDRSLRRYAGQHLWNRDGADLGEIKDFIVHVPTGRLHYAVVSTGGVLGMGNRLRLVPVEALREDDDGAPHITVDILQSRWLQVPPVSDDDYVLDHFAISEAQRAQIGNWFGVDQREPQAGQPADAAATAGLMRASALRGKLVRAGDRDAGSIENILIDLPNRRAALLVDAEGDFTGTDADYIVPLARLQMDNPRQNPIPTKLTRADFATAAPSNFGFPRARPMAERRDATDPTLAPTGRPTATRNSAGVVQPPEAAVAAVRSALRDDPALAVEKVEVDAENGKVVLRGAVRNQVIKSKIENAARSTAPAGLIDSRLTVEDR